MTNNGNSTFNYTPDNNFTGGDLVLITADDGVNAPEMFIPITVSGGNNAPVANGDMYTIPQNSTVLIYPGDNDTDADGDGLSITIDSSTGGSYSLLFDYMLVYTAPASTGTETITYTVDDSSGGTDTAM